MSNQTTKKLSKFISYVLRHHPQILNITMDEQGWVSVVKLLENLNGVSLDRLENIVTENNKKRFAFNDDKTRIRASQGHSIEIDLAYSPVEPPEFLFHGTAVQNIDSIKKSGIVKGERHHVHLSSDKETARSVGKRPGKPIILIIQSKVMHEAGYQIFVSENDVWLTEFVPVAFIEF
jgi:putative RNA 2'-phosphotransferase